MPRIKQFEARYVVKDFWVELDGQGGRQGLRSNAALGEAIGITGQSVGKYRKNIAPMKLETMQKLVTLLKPDIFIVLRLLGYTEKEIRGYAKHLQGV